MSEGKKIILGIDLGTTYTSVAYIDEYGKPVIVPNTENQNITPSVVFFDGDTIVVGEVAKESSKLYPNEVVSFIKRSMGESDYVFEYDGKTFRAEEISSFILRKVVQDAEKSLDAQIKDIVITCPAYFGINEREATKRAGEIAGYQVHQIINEPTAAAIAYGSLDENRSQKTVLVYDLGGGTFDITMIDIKSDSIEVICTGGDHNLGGKDWDDRVVAFLVQEFQNATQTDEDILEDPDTCQDLQLSAERSKKVLSQRDKTPILITHGGERVKVSLEKTKFEEITQDLLERTVTLTHEMLEEAAKKGYEKFDEIILVGGSSRMPQVSERIRQEFSVEPKIFDPDESVAKGAAIFAWKLAIQKGLIKRAAEKTGKQVESMDQYEDGELDDVLEELEQLVSEDTGYSVEDIKRTAIRIRNVASKSFGVVAHNSNDEEIVYNLIVKNKEVPVTTTKIFGTAVENQEVVSIQIMENESSSISTNPAHAVQIGTATLQLPPGLKTDTPVEITFVLNEEGRLQISAIEKTEQKKVDVDIDTKAVIQGEDLEKAIKRSQSLVVT